MRPVADLDLDALKALAQKATLPWVRKSHGITAGSGAFASIAILVASLPHERQLDDLNMDIACAAVNNIGALIERLERALSLIHI